MAPHFQSTIFGQLIRLLSGSRFFKYYDEINPSLWKKAVQQQGTPAPTIVESEQEDMEMRVVPSETSLSSQTLHPSGHEDGRDILVVGWYGPDDPEVL
jgi:MFS transporter, DHA1 family, multidrug resistance protein